jgi:hypothetical protein
MFRWHIYHHHQGESPHRKLEHRWLGEVLLASTHCHSHFTKIHAYRDLWAWISVKWLWRTLPSLCALLLVLSSYNSINCTAWTTKFILIYNVLLHPLVYFFVSVASFERAILISTQLSSLLTLWCHVIFAFGYALFESRTERRTSWLQLSWRMYIKVRLNNKERTLHPFPVVEAVCWLTFNQRVKALFYNCNNCTSSVSMVIH